MNTAKSPDTISFSPSFNLATYKNVRDGKRYKAEPMARLALPDMQTAVDFINAGLANDKRGAMSPVSLEYLQDVKESPTGEHGQYDAFVHTNRDTGGVDMMIRHYGPRGIEDHAALSEFVIHTIQSMPEQTPPSE